MTDAAVKGRDNGVKSFNEEVDFYAKTYSPCIGMYTVIANNSTVFNCYFGNIID